MTTKAQILTVITLAAPLMLVQGQTTTAASASTPTVTPTEQTIKDIKNPAPWLNWGADLRLRNEYFNNAQTLSSESQYGTKYYYLHSQDYFRFRGRVWANITPVEEFGIFARLAAEPREWMEPSSAANFRGGTAPFGRSGFEQRYGIIDGLNAQLKHPGGLPMTLTVGRQDIFMGDGWLVADGSPDDGSFTTFLDAARLTLDLKDQHTTIDAIGILQHGRPDAWIPTMGPSTSAGSPYCYLLTEQDERGAILWIANKSLPALNVDGYFIYKQDTRISSSVARLDSTFGDDADIFTLGGRLSGVIADHWKYSAEGAYQWGEKKDAWIGKAVKIDPSAVTSDYRDIRAFGVNSKVSYLFKDTLNNQVSFSYEFLSGDNKSTKNDEMFDVLWGRWPRWSELYAPYSYIPESRTGQQGNYHRFGPGWNITPVKNLDFSANYFALFADQDIPTRANTAHAFAGGDFRGHYVQTVLKYKFSQHMSGHLWGEMLFPGNYYASHQTMTFLRAELMFTF
jgi:hypothetical protein